MKTNDLSNKIIHVKPVRTFADCKAHAVSCREGLRDKVQTKLAELRMTQPTCDLRYAPSLLGYENPYDEIYNIISQFNNAMDEGWHFFFEAERLRRELAELKGRSVEVVECKVIDEHKNA